MNQSISHVTYRRLWTNALSTNIIKTPNEEILEAQYFATTIYLAFYLNLSCIYIKIYVSEGGREKKGES